MLSAGTQLFGLKTTLHGKPDLRNEFLPSAEQYGQQVVRGVKEGGISKENLFN